MVMRKIVVIDEEKCNGCGLCIPNCHEGALKIIEGKAKLVNEVYCDGLGNCLGHCPQDAIHVVEKDVADFDFDATNKHLRNMGKEELKENPLEAESDVESEADKMIHGNSLNPALAESHKKSIEGSLPCGCPGTMIRDLRTTDGHKKTGTQNTSPRAESELRQWPVQLHLVPPNAGFLNGSDLLISADCVSAAHPNFHREILKGKSMVMGCPKLDALDEYKDKIKSIIEMNDLNTVTVAIMEVPCCQALYHAVEQALDESGKRLTLKHVTVGIDGKQKH